MNNVIYSRYTSKTKGSLMGVRTSLAALLLLTVSIVASAATEESQLDKIQSEMHSVINKAGIDFSGSFKSQYLGSVLSQTSGDSAINWGKNKTETNEFTSVDFDIKARPNDALTGRLIFRMHQNWQNFFSDVGNPIFTRWISIDGNVDDMFRFNVGDFRQHYSALTLWSPDIEIDYEPEIFAARRQDAEKEVFIGNNDRLLQGMNFNMDAEVVPILNEFHLNLLGARLRSGGTLTRNGSFISENVKEGPATTMDRYLLGGNLDLLFLKGFGLGASVLKVFDVPSTSDESVITAEKIARSGLITAFRLQPNSSIFMESEQFNLGLDFEAAMSSNQDSTWFLYDTVQRTPTVVVDTTVDATNINGMAINFDFKGKMSFGETNNLKVKIGFMLNDSSYLNEMAQSPTFLGQRIMNFENDPKTGALYSTFDALYNHVFKFAPNAGNGWSKVPRRKISYVTAILSPAEIDSLKEAGTYFFVNGDPTFQTVLPYGPATPNRSGIKGNVNLKLLDGAVDAGGCFAMLSEVKMVAPNTEKANFTKIGAGLAVDIAKWATVLNTCEVSGGLSMENVKIGDIKGDNTFINAGLYYNFWQRFSLLGGYQQIVNKATTPFGNATLTQTQTAAGLEYKVSETGKLTGRFGTINVKHDTSPAYDFSTTQSELFMTVDF